MALALAVPPRTFAQPIDLETQYLREGVFVVRGPDANALAFVTDEGVALVDGGSPTWAPQLQAAIARATGERAVHALINTHWHPEQVGSNEMLGSSGVEIIAHDNTRSWLSTEVRQRWSGRRYPPLPEQARPNSTVYDSEERVVGGKPLYLGYALHAHTDGDLYVYLPKENILFAGGFLTNDSWPVIDWWTGGWTGGMLNAFDAILPLCDADTVVVPSSGALMSYQQFREQREMYLTIFEKIHQGFVKSLGPDEIVQTQPTAGYRPEWGEPDLFVTLAVQSLHGHLRGGVGGWLPRIP
jgi:Zn-dependent hydrolases, including glyoxylases